MLTDPNDVAAYQQAVDDIRNVVENIAQFASMLPSPNDDGHVSASLATSADLNAIRKLLIVVEELAASTEADLLRVGQR